MGCKFGVSVCVLGCSVKCEALANKGVEELLVACVPYFEFASFLLLAYDIVRACVCRFEIVLCVCLNFGWMFIGDVCMKCQYYYWM